jgi:nitronate monooxygenase
VDLLQRLGISLPIIQAPMAGVQGNELASAVCSAGGMGSLACAMLSPEQLRNEYSALQQRAPAAFNLNFFCHTPAPVSPAQDAAWKKQLAPYYAEYSIDPAAVAGGASRMPFSNDTADLLESLKPPVVSFHFGLPNPEIVARLKSWGTLLLSSATTVAEARWLQENGADAVIAQGSEAGGHRGMFLSDDLSTQSGTFALLPQVVAALDIPVIAAGGIASAEAVKAALDLGASAVQAGTVYLLCPECNTSELHRTALKSDGACHTAITNVFTGRPARSIVNRIIREQGPMAENIPGFPRAASAVTALRTAAEQAGRPDFTPLWCGQNASGCEELPAAALTRKLAALVTG